ncbi:MAG TPA: hypothetical protein IGS52_12720 [Oscillatoriaceae cyanobacterium M33_DOE_052]|uniref:Uncharacterized protein n=1 Tax=Planktothricoides sp. SpSt-374 TaxID=2282167 RepID=A0A7C3VG82_9CYAN|nr:hypothetical protein [Oscillatoriaceae cyanobacterium M33_DOE_052]
MSPGMLRQLWNLIEQTQVNTLLSLNDTTLVHWLIEQLKQERTLNSDETHVIKAYLCSKLSLIRDMASARLAS